MAKRSRVLSVQEAIEQLLDALNDDGQLPPSLRHQLRHGLECREAHRFGGLDVDIAITARGVPAVADRERWRAAALAKLLAESWSDRCDCQVPDRSPFRSRGRMKNCAKPVQAVLVLTPNEFLSFRCAQHLDRVRDKTTIRAAIEFSSRELAVIRMQRKRAENERHERRRQVEIIAKDARIEGRFADALLILTEVMDRDEALERLAS